MLAIAIPLWGRWWRASPKGTPFWLRKQPSKFFSFICYAIAAATFFLVPSHWYWALLAAFIVFFATGIIRAAIWKITGRDWP
jgi:hypothetical protein